MTLAASAKTCLHVNDTSHNKLECLFKTSISSLIVRFGGVSHWYRPRCNTRAIIKRKKIFAPKNTLAYRYLCISDIELSSASNENLTRSCIHQNFFPSYLTNGPNKLVCVPGKPFRPSVMFEGYDLTGKFQFGRLRPYPQSLHLAERLARDKHSSLSGPNCKLKIFFVHTTPGPNVLKLFIDTIYECSQ